MRENRAKLEDKLKARPTLLERHSAGIRAEEAKVSNDCRIAGRGW